ncbi:MAG: DUF488 family protein [Flavobacteriales bacterium]|nr:DUF488 family protein [Flavobacteriales bacterium]
MRFIAMMELRTHGAIGDRLEQAGDTRMAAWVRKLAAPLVARVDSSRKEEAEQRTGLKELLSVSGLPTLLSDERYEPRLPFGHRKDEPTVLPFTLEQISLLGRAVVKVKDAYDPQEPDDGLRVFIDREPPRTVLARWIQVDAWLDEPRPSRHLFDWFGQDPERWAEFEHHYHRELRFQPYAMERTLKRLSRGPFTLLHKKRGEFSVARALANYLLKHYPHVFEAG